MVTYILLTHLAEFNARKTCMKKINIIGYKMYFLKYIAAIIKQLTIWQISYDSHKISNEVTN